MRHPDQLHLGRPAHRAHPGHELLRADHRGPAGRLRVGDLGGLGELGDGDHPARRPDRRLASPTARSPARSPSPPRARPTRPGGQTYTVTACTNAGMTTGCVTNASLTSGANLTGLAYVAGLGGHGLLRHGHGQRLERLPRLGAVGDGRPAERDEPGERAGHPDGRVVDDDRRRDHGDVQRRRRASRPASYTAIACTNAGMTTGCVTQTNYTSGAQLTGLTQGTSYYVHDHRGPAGGLHLGHLGGLGELGRRDDPARHAQHAGPRLRRGRGLDHGHLHVVERPRRRDLHGHGLHERGHDDRLRDQRRRSPRARRSRASPTRRARSAPATT